MARKPKVIVSGLDGTMLLNGAQRLQSSMSNLIHRLTEENILFVAASGRQYANMRRLFSPVKNEIAYICERGGLSVYHKEIISQDLIPYQVGQEVIAAISEQEGCQGILTDKDTCYVSANNMDLFYHVRGMLGYDVEVIPDLEIADIDCIKVTIYKEGGGIDVDWWRKKFGDRAEVIVASDEYLDIMPMGIEKGRTLQKVLEHLSIDPEDCLAIGSRDHDDKMLRISGCPIVLDEASDELKKYAKFTAESVQQVLTNILDGEGYDW